MSFVHDGAFEHCDVLQLNMLFFKDAFKNFKHLTELLVFVSHLKPILDRTGDRHRRRSEGEIAATVAPSFLLLV